MTFLAFVIGALAGSAVTMFIHARSMRRLKSEWTTICHGWSEAADLWKSTNDNASAQLKELLRLSNEAIQQRDAYREKLAQNQVARLH